MDRRVWHPGAAHVRRSLLIGEGGGIFPGRLPFIDPLRRETPPSFLLFARQACPVSEVAKKFVKKA
jgi:hypothetical protein